MQSLIDDVREFHERFGVPIRISPALPEDRVALRRDLILEETVETAKAIERGDLIEVADGLADLIYVCIGAALEFGLPLDRVWAEVHRTNMMKAGGATRPDGKILKPDGWQPPDIRRAIGMDGLGDGVIDDGVRLTPRSINPVRLQAEIEALRADLIWALANHAHLWVDDGPLGNRQRSIAWRDTAGYLDDRPHDGTDDGIIRAVREARQG